MSKKTALLIVIIVWVLIAGALILYNEINLRTGQKVLLRTAQIDPRDIMRGDYMTLNYEISNLRLFTGLNPGIKQGDSVYVILQNQGKYWNGTFINKNKPKEGVFIRGRVLLASEYSGISNYRIDYGINDYFVPEGKARTFSRSDLVDVEVSIDREGTARITRVFVNEQELKFR